MSFALETQGLSRSFGGFKANSEISISIPAGERRALIGPNGAGKTTFINLLTGVLQPTAGKVILNAEDVTRLSPQARVRRGMARTFQINQLFPDLTPLETIILTLSQRAGLGAQWSRRAGADSAITDEAETLLQRMGLADAIASPTRTLPYGKQRLLEVATALACKPTLLLLDEPAAGVPEEERREILDMVGALPDNVTVLLIEHDMELVFAFADRISVLTQGALFAEGSVDEIASDPRVRAVYLGEDAPAATQAARHG